MRKNIKRAISGVAGMTMAVSAQVAAAEAVAKAETVYNEISNVQGEFTFDQNVIAPTDRVFSLFGTVATAICAKPGFAFKAAEDTQYFVNVGGKVKKDQSISLAQMKKGPTTTRTMLCACATGGATAQTMITGIPVSRILQVAEVDEAANAIAFRSADGYTQTMPLSYVLEKDAMLVYRIGDRDIPEGVQVWMPGTVASYFTRQVVDIELLRTEEELAVREMPAEHRAQVSFVNTVEDSFHVGDRLSFEGYADDLGSPIAAVEFSMDGGKTWTAYETSDTVAEKWVCWRFDYDTKQAGTYRLDVRARTVDGILSPLAASVTFEVKET